MVLFNRFAVAVFLCKAIFCFENALAQEDIFIPEILSDNGHYDVSAADAGYFGTAGCDFRIAMDIRGKGPGTLEVVPWQTSGATRYDAAIFIRSSNPSYPYDGPFVWIVNGGINVELRRDEYFDCGDGYDFASDSVKHLEIYRSGNSLTLEIGETVCQNTITKEPDNAFISNAPLRFGANHIVPSVQRLNLDLSNITFTTSCRDHFQAPTPAPTSSAVATGDPHFSTWSGRKFDFHGVCDLVLIQNPEFQQGLGLEIHARTKQMKQFSYISSAVLQVGNETLEVMGDIHKNLFWINKRQGEDTDKEGIVGEINGYSINYQKVNSKQHEFIVNLGGASILLKTYKNFVHVGVSDATESSFGLSKGLLGAYGTGELTSRDGSKIFENTDEFGQEWQVGAGDGNLFHKIEGPQAPAKCQIPVATNIRRRLAESKVSMEDAKLSCANVDADVFEMCVFDVMATGDSDVAGAY